MTRLNDDVLQRIQGGEADWLGFGKKVIESLGDLSDLIDANDIKALVEAIKTKNSTEIAIVAIPIIAKYPPLQKIFLEFR